MRAKAKGPGVAVQRRQGFHGGGHQEGTLDGLGAPWARLSAAAEILLMVVVNGSLAGRGQRHD